MYISLVQNRGRSEIGWVCAGRFIAGGHQDHNCSTDVEEAVTAARGLRYYLLDGSELGGVELESLLEPAAHISYESSSIDQSLQERSVVSNNISNERVSEGHYLHGRGELSSLHLS